MFSTILFPISFGVLVASSLLALGCNTNLYYALLGIMAGSFISMGVSGFAFVNGLKAGTSTSPPNPLWKRRIVFFTTHIVATLLVAGLSWQIYKELGVLVNSPSLRESLEAKFGKNSQAMATYAYHLKNNPELAKSIEETEKTIQGRASNQFVYLLPILLAIPSCLIAGLLVLNDPATKPISEKDFIEGVYDYNN